MGGLSKKAFLVRSLMRDPNHPALLIESGNMLLQKNFSKGEEQEAEIRARAMVQASQAMGGEAMGLGALDFRAGMGLLSSLHRPPTFSLLSANLLDSQKNEPLFAPYSLQKAGDMRVAIIGLSDHASIPTSSQFRLLPWQQTLPNILLKVENQADIIVLLSNYSLAENQAIARQFPVIDCIFQAGHVIGNKTPIRIGNTLISQTDIRGKYVGVLDIEWNGHRTWQQAAGGGADTTEENTFGNRFIAIKESLHEDPLVANIVKQAKRKLAKTP